MMMMMMMMIIMTMMRFTPTALDSRVSVMHSADGKEAAAEELEEEERVKLLEKEEELVEVLEKEAALEEEEKGVVRGLKRQQVTAEREL